MDKEEILERNKQSFPEDEGKEYVEMRARKFGEIGLLIVCAIFLIYKIVMRLPFEDIWAILWAYEGSQFIYRYKYHKTKNYLFYAIFFLVSALFFIFGYVIQNW